MSTGKQLLDVVIGNTGSGALGKCLLPFGEVRRLRQQRQGFRLKRWWCSGSTTTTGRRVPQAVSR